MDSRDVLNQTRIEAIKDAARRAAQGELVAWVCDDASGAGHEAVLRRIAACKEAATTTLTDELTRAGVPLPDPDTLDDEQLRDVLWQVIFALATLQVFVECTDHLSDRELYVRLWAEDLPQDIELDLPPDPMSAWHIDLVSTGSDESIHAWLKYYADDETRSFWARDNPDYTMPEQEEPPYDRDRLMPAAAF